MELNSIYQHIHLFMIFNEYIKFIDDGVNGVFSDDVGTGRVVKELIDSLVNDEYGNSTVSSFCKCK